MEVAGRAGRLMDTLAIRQMSPCLCNVRRYWSQGKFNLENPGFNIHQTRIFGFWKLARLPGNPGLPRTWVSFPNQYCRIRALDRHGSAPHQISILGSIIVKSAHPNQFLGPKFIWSKATGPAFSESLDQLSCWLRSSAVYVANQNLPRHSAPTRGLRSPGKTCLSVTRGLDIYMFVTDSNE